MIKENGVYIMESAEIIGKVSIGPDSSVWNKAVIRGDDESVTIGKNTNIQDMCMVHPEHDIPMEIGDNVSIGHRAIVHCKKIGSNCLIGMGAILLDNVEIGKYSIIAAGSVIAENRKIPPRSVVMGVPGKIVREANEKDLKLIQNTALQVFNLAVNHSMGKYETHDINIK